MNNFGIIWHPLFPFEITLPVLVLMGVFLIWKEYRRSISYRNFRILAILLILLSLSGFFLRPGYLKPSGDHALLLTPGFQRSTVDSLIRLYPRYQTVRLKETSAYSPADIILDEDNLSSFLPKIHFVTGTGLSSAILHSLDSIHFQFIPAPLPTGIISLQLPDHPVPGQSAMVKGVYNNHGATTISIKDPGGVEDSIVLTQSGQVPFTLTLMPKLAGNFLFEMTMKDSAGVIHEQLPVVISDRRPIRILLLQKFPTAETRYLKNLLSEQGHALTIRYQTSRNNYRYEYVHQSPTKVDLLTNNLLDNFDLLLIDGTVLNELTPAERTTLESSIRNGLGVLLWIDEFPAKGKFERKLLNLPLQPAKKDTVHLRLSGNSEHTFPITPIQLKEDPSLQPITVAGVIVSGYVYSGAGKVGFQFLHETYRLLLEGDENSYATIWVPLLEGVARRFDNRTTVSFEPGFPIVENDPIEITVLHQNPGLALFDGNLPIPLTEDVIVDDLWHGATTAGDYGWHELRTPPDTTQTIYFAHHGQDWKSLQLAHQMERNRIFAQTGFSTQIQLPREEQLVNQLIFYLLFLLAAGFLWLAPKL